MDINCYKNKWDNPYTERIWYERGNCRKKVSAKSMECKHCGAKFINVKKG